MTPAFVAEVSSNHHRDLDRCFAFIDTAARLGCQAVKFQLFHVAQLFAPEALASNPRLRERVAWELPPSFLPALASRCAEVGIDFMCTPFYVEAVEELRPYVAAYKVASYELLWDELLVACAQTGKPMLLSVGMATLDEIDHAVARVRDAGCRDLTLLHCISGYPAPVQECNLAAIETIRRSFGCPVGWSDHSVNAGVIQRAVHHWNASVVEFHLDLDGAGSEFQAGHCWLPDQIGTVIRAVRDGLSSDGDGAKLPAPAELSDREWRADPSDGLRPLLKTRRGLRAPART